MSSYDAFASAYDILNTEIDYPAMAEHIGKVFSSSGIERGALVLDLGCGTGTLTRLLADLGYDMTAVDSSEEMLCRAREKGSEGILYLCQDITEFELYGTVAAAVCTTDTVNHITDPAELSHMFDLLHNYIEPGGLFLFDVNSPYKFGHVYGNADYVLEDEGVMLTWQNDYDPAEGIADFYITLFEEQEDGMWSRSDTDFSERCYSAAELEAMLEKSGFEVISVTDAYSDTPAGEKSQRLCITARRV